MKKLNHFVKFDNKFFDKLRLQVGKVEPFYDYVDGKKQDMPAGYKMSCSVLIDDNSYGDDGKGLNETEQFFVKVRFPMWSDGVPYAINGFNHKACKLRNPDAKVYGQWGSNLSVTVTDPSQIEFCDFTGKTLPGCDKFGYLVEDSGK